MSDRLTADQRSKYCEEFGISSKLSRSDQETFIYAYLKMKPAESKRTGRSARPRLADDEHLVALSDEAALEMKGELGITPKVQLRLAREMNLPVCVVGRAILAS